MSPCAALPQIWLTHWPSLPRLQMQADEAEAALADAQARHREALRQLEEERSRASALQRAADEAAAARASADGRLSELEAQLEGERRRIGELQEAAQRESAARAGAEARLRGLQEQVRTQGSGSSQLLEELQVRRGPRAGGGFKWPRLCVVHAAALQGAVPAACTHPNPTHPPA